ncbi:MAG: hypothetical protein GWN01_00335, partial [Nitrosopumilaceae archaeon]|nr:hypothetical protein [Nitrosopumilaceae archaeon]NIV64645.1 hypothetical protein [Nitrosopumilaceae archaeon]NIX60034.1 hypothetical protein [Nitrosopumilaceae archaeon]
FNTFGVDLKTKFKAEDIIPVIGANYQTSDGHVDKAEYTRGTINGGVEGQAWKNGVFQLMGRYRNEKQSLWSRLIPSDSTQETKTDLWHWQANLDQKLGKHFSVFTGGHFQLSEFENRFDYTQSLLSVVAGETFTTGHTSIELLGRANRNNTERETSNTSQQWKTEYSLYSSILSINQKVSNFSATTGIKAQHLETESN